MRSGRTALAKRDAAGKTQQPATVRRAEAGIERRNRLVEEHAEMVRTIAARIGAALPPSFELDDLIQAGMMALLKAAARYRRVQGPGFTSPVPFGLYARHAVRGAILDSVSGRHYRDATGLELPAAEEMGRAAGPEFEAAIDRRRRLARVRHAIAYLTPEKRALLERCYGAEAMTFQAAGEQIGLERRRAGEMHAEAIGELRRILHAA